MKKIVHILLLSIFLSGCTALQNLGQLITSPTAPPPVATATPFESATPIPTQNLFATSTSTPPTFTPTVTAIGAELFTPTNTETPFPTPGLPPDAFSGNYFTPKSVGFLAVLISNNLMYWNEGPCSPRSIKVSAFVEDVINTHRVLLFTRLREKKNTLNVTEWNSGAIMTKADNGSFNYDVHTFNLRRYFYFKDAWLEYQLVALTEDLEIIGRTGIYDRNISLVRCLPVPVP
jgi:hypothetical protein